MSNVITPSVRNTIIDDRGNEYSSIRSLAEKIGMNRAKISSMLKEHGKICVDGITYTTKDFKGIDPEKILEDKNYQEFLKAKEAQELPFKEYVIEPEKKDDGGKYAIALFSDAHIEETIEKESVMGKNEYNMDIARERIMAYFRNLVQCINHDGVRKLVFASLGDTISGFIHDELEQMNSMTPLEATMEAQSMILGGLEYICDNTDLERIDFIGIVGNHSRSTRRVQHSNGYKMSYEWMMYQNLKKECEYRKLPINFNIPGSEMAIVDMNGKRYIFVHGHQIKSQGTATVCGIYPALNRLSLKWGRTFNQDKIFLGHFHSCISIPSVTVNGSIIGYNSFALSNGFTYEEPAQMYEVYDSKGRLLVTRKIYCE